MSDMKARQMIEALRSGVPSRLVGRYFSEARGDLMRQITDRLDHLKTEDKSSGMIITGKYGEGKTHLLNSVFAMAQERNMVVSWLPLSKETPLDKLHLVYPKLIASTYLPGHEEPGFMNRFEEKLPDSSFASDLLMKAASDLSCNKIYYVLKTLIREQDEEMKYRLECDLEGDFMPNADIKREYRALYHEAAKFNENFRKTQNCPDYLIFMSALFQQLGYDGWVILIDEAELMGRLGKKARINAYTNMAQFLIPAASLHSVFSMLAFTASYPTEVIEGKQDYENLAELFPENQEPARTVMDQICKAKQLAPLSESEIRMVVEKIIDYHQAAYDWQLNTDPSVIADKAVKSGVLLRTKLRTAIEMLDQIYQYGSLDNIRTTTVDQETYEEDTQESL